MGMIGRWLDGADEKEQDGVIEGQDWCVGILVEGSGARCMLGHAGYEDYPTLYHEYVGLRFDALARRVGLTRAVQLVKMRASKANRVAIPESETVEVAP